MMASKDDNKCKYAADSAAEEVEEALPKNQKTISGDDNGVDDGDEHGDDEDSTSSSSSTNDDYLSEPNEEVYSKEEMNTLTGSEEKLLIR
jgi:hypothetical protein